MSALKNRMLFRKNGGLHPKSESGQELVEGAFVLLIIFLFLFGIFELGRVLQTRQALTDAAREGARRSVAPLTQTSTLATASDVRGVVQNYLSAAHITLPSGNIAVNQAVTLGSDPTQYTRVTVTYAYPVMTLKIFGFNNVSIVGSALMRNETSP